MFWEAESNILNFACLDVPSSTIYVSLITRTLRVLIVDEADLMFSYGYEEDACCPERYQPTPLTNCHRKLAEVKALCALMPPKYQACAA